MEKYLSENQVTEPLIDDNGNQLINGVVILNDAVGRGLRKIKHFSTHSLNPTKKERIEFWEPFETDFLMKLFWEANFNDQIIEAVAIAKELIRRGELQFVLHAMLSGFNYPGRIFDFILEKSDPYKTSAIFRWRIEGVIEQMGDAKSKQLAEKVDAFFVNNKAANVDRMINNAIQDTSGKISQAVKNALKKVAEKRK